MRAMNYYHPAVLITYFAAVLVIAMFVANPLLQIFALIGGILFCAMLCGRRGAGGDIAFYACLFFLITVTNPIFSHNGVTPLFFLNGNPVTLEAFVYGAAIAVMVIAVIIWCKCYSKIMTTDKFLYLFSGFIPKLSLVLSMALRFIPMFKRQMKRVSHAQRAMGLYSSKSYIDKIREYCKVFSAVVAWAMENSVQISSVMKARGYSVKKRTSFSLFKFKKGDVALACVTAVLLAVTLAGVLSGATVFYYYPEISNINLSVGSALTYSAFFILSFLPFIIEVKEAVVWRYCVSKV